MTAYFSFHRHRFLGHCCSGKRRYQNFEKMTYVFKPFGFYFFGLSLFFFSYHFAAVLHRLLGLLLVQEFPRKHHRDEKFLPRSSQV